jgi:putative tricarboxylic transport membrane protein
VPTDAPTEAREPPRAGSVVVAALMIAVACVVLWDSTRYTDADSAVFPRTFAVVLIVASLAYIVVWLLGRADPEVPPSPGSAPRRILLVVAMLAGALAMPMIGFVAAALPVFGALLLVAMYDPWTRFRMVVYPLVGIAVVLGFYYVFQELLLVPLPAARLF